MEQSLARSLVEDILRIIDKAVKQHDDNKDIIEKCNFECTDFLHEIELGKHNASQICKLYSDFKASRVKRRKAKNENQTLGLLVQFFDQNTQLRNGLIKVMQNIKLKEKDIENQFYIPRVKADLSITDKTPFRVYNTKEEVYND